MDILFEIAIKVSIIIVELKIIEAFQDSFYHTILADVCRAS